MNVNDFFGRFRCISALRIKARTICTMLCIYWLAADRYMEFTRGQEVSERLSEPQSHWIRAFSGQNQRKRS